MQAWGAGAAVHPHCTLTHEGGLGYKVCLGSPMATTAKQSAHLDHQRPHDVPHALPLLAQHVVHDAPHNLQRQVDSTDTSPSIVTACGTQPARGTAA